MYRVSRRILSMPYAVANGRRPGVYDTWAECKAQVHGFKAAKYKKFPTLAEAQEFAFCGSKVKGVGGGGTSSRPDLPPLPSADSAPLKLPSKSSIRKDPQAVKVPRQIKLLDQPPTENASFIRDANQFVQVFTDGACEGNGQAGARAGIGVWWNHHHELNLAAPIFEGSAATNNVAEIQAAIAAIRLAKKAQVSHLCINTDSQFMINCITQWIHGWKKNGWTTSTRQPVKNKVDLVILDQELEDEGLEVKWNHVRGHAGIEGNEMADQLARAGARQHVAKVATTPTL